MWPRRVGGIAAGAEGGLRSSSAAIWVSWAAALSARNALFRPIGFPWISLDSLVRIETYQWVMLDSPNRQFCRALWPNGAGDAKAGGGVFGGRARLSCDQPTPHSNFPQPIVVPPFNPNSRQRGAASAKAPRHDVADVRRERGPSRDAPQHHLGVTPADRLERAPRSHCGEQARGDLRIRWIEGRDRFFKEREPLAVGPVELSLVGGKAADQRAHAVRIGE